MNRYVKALFAFLVLLALLSSIAFATQTTKASVKWIKSSSTKFEYIKDFSKVRYRNAIYELPKQISKLATSMQQDIRKEFIKVKVVELKAQGLSIAQGIVFVELQDRIDKLTIEVAKTQTKAEIERLLNKTTDEQLKSILNNHRDSIVSGCYNSIQKELFIEKQVILAELAEKVAAQASSAAIKNYVEKASKTTMRTSYEGLYNAVAAMTQKYINIAMSSHVTKTINDKVKKLLPDELDNSILRMEQILNTPVKKPVIYLYPTKTQQVNVDIVDNVSISCAYPSMTENGWNVTAYPDGTLIDQNTGREYYCLYWEGYFAYHFDMTSGFVVKGSDTASFLEKQLKVLGLTDKEANEFIIYWLPQLQRNQYNLIHFATDEYNQQAALKVNPMPDTQIRVLMVFKALDQPIKIKEQQIDTKVRNGFTLVEWGGIEIK